ncbi:hypothetical protein AB6A40_007019 [Gnathostoma spinigerum]|uniref:Integrase n=1 Tax=Gnathostoma spinigerum TaxID=75299 RepID=A0ABD6EVN1_9BILA
MDDDCCFHKNLFEDRLDTDDRQTIYSYLNSGQHKTMRNIMRFRTSLISQLDYYSWHRNKSHVSVDKTPQKLDDKFLVVPKDIYELNETYYTRRTILPLI